MEIQDNLNPLNHFTKTKALVESHLKDLLKTMKGFKFIETLEVTFIKATFNSKTGEREDIYKTAFFRQTLHKRCCLSTFASYIELPIELKNPAKGLINIKNKDDECFRWCHIRHLNPQRKNPQRIKKDDKKYIGGLDYTNIEFPVSQKEYNKIEKQNSIFESTYLVMNQHIWL